MELPAVKVERERKVARHLMVMNGDGDHYCLDEKSDL